MERQAPLNLFQVFDWTAAIQAKDAAVAQVSRGMPSEWRLAALEAIERIEPGREFTTDLLWQSLEIPPEPRAMGAVMTTAQRYGWVEHTGRFGTSAIVRGHHRPVRIWRRV